MNDWKRYELSCGCVDISIPKDGYLCYVCRELCDDHIQQDAQPKRNTPASLLVQYWQDKNKINFPDLEANKGKNK